MTISIAYCIITMYYFGLITFIINLEELTMFNQETNYASPAVEMLYISSTDVITESNDNEAGFDEIKNLGTSVGNS